jgi:hypothetical protein
MKTAKHLRRAVSGMAIVFGLAAAIPAIASAAVPLPGALHTTHSGATPRGALYGGVWTVENSPGTYDSSPNRNHPNGDPLPNGTKVSLNCYYFGAPAGPYGNTLWYEVGFGEWINDHYLNTPGTAASPQLQAPHCYGAGSGEGVFYGPKFRAVNSPGAFGNSPTAARDVSGFGVANNDVIGLGCYYYGNPTGPYGNTLWYLADDLTNHTYGFINDHYLNTPGTATNPQPQTPHC